MPSGQQARDALNRVVKQYAQEYRAAEGQLQKTSVMVRRKQALSELFASARTIPIDNWQGRIEHIATGSSGAITILKVSFGSFSLTFGSLKPDSELYSQLVSFGAKEGDEVVVVAEALGRDEKNFIAEDSWTEKGAMEQPEFKATLRSIRSVR